MSNLIQLVSKNKVYAFGKTQRSKLKLFTLQPSRLISVKINTMLSMQVKRILSWSTSTLPEVHVLEVGTHKGTRWGDMKQGQVAAAVFLNVTCPFLWKSFVVGTKLCPRNMSHKIQLVWICASCSRDKRTSSFNFASCALLLQSVPTTTYKWTYIWFMCTLGK